MNIKMNNLSPIAVFAYNRLDHLKKTIDSLKKCNLSKNSNLIIYLDNYKKVTERDKVMNIRKYCLKIKGFKTIKLIQRKKNLGMSKNIISGVGQTLKKFKKGIFLEDDMMLDKYFLEFMNYYLEVYKNNHKISSIHGYSYPTNKKLPDYFFLKGADCWGWATWSRAWNIFSNDSKHLLSKIKKKELVKEFNFNNSYNYFKMLKQNLLKKNKRWAINWYASCFLKDKLTLYPGRSLVHNFGNDLSGTNCKETEVFNVKLRNKPLKFTQVMTLESEYAKKEFEFFFLSIMSLRNRLMRYFGV